MLIDKSKTLDSDKSKYSSFIHILALDHANKHKLRWFELLNCLSGHYLYFAQTISLFSLFHIQLFPKNPQITLRMTDFLFI